MDGIASCDFKHGKVSFRKGQGYRVADKVGGYFEGNGWMVEIPAGMTYQGEIIVIGADDLNPHANLAEASDADNARPAGESVTLDVHDIGQLNAAQILGS